RSSIASLTPKPSACSKRICHLYSVQRGDFPTWRAAQPDSGHIRLSRCLTARDSRVVGFSVCRTTETPGHLRLGDQHDECGESSGSATRTPAVPWRRPQPAPPPPVGDKTRRGGGTLP